MEGHALAGDPFFTLMSGEFTDEPAGTDGSSASGTTPGLDDVPVVLEIMVYPPDLFKYAAGNCATPLALVYAQLLHTSTLDP